MVTKVLIAPVGINKTRLQKSILRSGAQRLYLIKGKGEYSEITQEVCDSLKNALIEYLMFPKDQILEEEPVDFHDFKDIYRVFAKIIEKEKYRDKDSEITIDISSTTKEATIVSSLLGSLYDVSLSYVPPQEKASPETLRKRLAKEGSDSGGEYILIKIRQSKGLSKDERLALKRVYEHKGYESMTAFIGDIAKEKQKDVGQKHKRYWIRLLHKLEDKGLIRVYEGFGLTKSFNLTPAGEGILQGIIEFEREVSREEKLPERKTETKEIGEIYEKGRF